MDIKQQMGFVFRLYCPCLFFIFTSCGPDIPSDVAFQYEQLPDNLDYNIHVKPILSDKCFLCHGPDKAKLEAGLRLDQKDNATGLLSNHPGKRAITPSNLQSSEVFNRIMSLDPHVVMPTPKSNLTLTAREKAVIIKWIEEGANYKPHWAFEKPVKREIPDDAFDTWGINGIDYFVNQKLENQSLTPNTQANKASLLRRLSFDLIGLPPSIDELETFMTDQSPEAYEKQVDRLLASKHYGEKMAIDWMDLARYSDTHGYLSDFYRDVSPWRDWVIKSFNENLSYKDFLQWQLAGDLFENPSQEQILATTFNRLHPQNLEDGIIDEEYRVEYVADRVSILGTGLMGMSLACAKCHDHKFDPISQKNFYELFSFFNNINETGLIPWEGSMPVPTLLLTKEKEQAIIDYLDGLVEEKKDEKANIENLAKVEAQNWINTDQFQDLKSVYKNNSLKARFLLDGDLTNSLKRNEKGEMDREFSKNEVPTYANGKEGKGLLIDGDAWLDLKDVGVFQRKDAFSIGIWVNIPSDLEEGVIFHKNKGTRLHSYRGYHLYLTDNKLQLMLAHTWPDNAIVKYSKNEIPKDQWVHLMMTYDGSSKADGLNLFINGKQEETTVEIDNLYKDIVFFKLENSIYPNPIEPGLQIGGRWRGVGIKGAKVDDILVCNAELTPLEILQIADKESFKNIIVKSSKELSHSENSLFESYYVRYFSEDYQKSAIDLQEARTTLFDSIEQIQEIMVMKEMEETRQAYVLDRGMYDAPAEKVFPSVPNAILSWPDSLPKNRLGLAKWLTHPEHPLTARVAVNRYWQNFFGRGLVRTTEDFGNQGEMPSHPELLDWLALSFMDSGWDIKAFQKLIVMSATYRQDSKLHSDLDEKDPDNVFLARGPSVRLTSEMIRDNALFASGLLNDKIGGESVYPYQPDGLWSMNTGKYIQDKGDNLYRRSLYTIWKRTVPNPTLFTFDQPDREVCTVRRQKTNTPLQALVLLNDPTFIEAAKVIGETITKENQSTEESVTTAYKLITGFDIDQEQLKVLSLLQKSEYAVFKNDKEKRKGWIEAGEYKIDPSLDADLVAANAIVASVILNSDASITKR